MQTKIRGYPAHRQVKKLLSLFAFVVLVSMHMSSLAGILATDSVQTGGQWRTYKLFLPAGRAVRVDCS